jgi:purine-binding chemotaxis protein CheW
MKPAAPGPGLAPHATAEQRRAVLRERARELAQSRDEERRDVVPLLPFTVGGERYALEVACVRQVLEARRVDPLFGAPRGVLGAVFARTRPVPVLDLRHLLGLEGGGLSDLQRVVVLDDAGDLFGIAVERVERRLEVPAAELRPSETGAFRWVTADRTAVLDPSRLALASRQAGS